VIVGGFARVVHGSGEITRALDIVPSLREENVRRLDRAVDELGATGTRREPITADALAGGEPLGVATPAGTLNLVPAPWGTRGYDDIRIRGNRENLGRGLRPRSHRPSTSSACSKRADAAKTPNASGASAA